jgi:hypothetical protein
MKAGNKQILETVLEHLDVVESYLPKTKEDFMNSLVLQEFIHEMRLIKL